MRIDPGFRGQGVAMRLLRHAMANAKHGFEPCQPFGSYLKDPHSVYMTRAVDLS